MNEEDVKNRVIIPFLNSIGFNEYNLSYEYNFTIKLGKNTVKKKDYISGRLDILVKIDNVPFLLWEIKKEGFKITDEEVGQAISYARLTEPITPYTVVSNGRDTQIYNTISKEKIKKENIRKGQKLLDFKETIKNRMEAFSEIVCYSKDNLINFFKYINNRELERVKGNKYIREIYIQREKVNTQFKNFLEDENKLFFITGKAGVGKTNVMVNILENNMEQEMMLFYNACFITKSILDQIKDDFNYTFDEQLFNRQLFNRINYLAKKENKKVIILIDAIDELAIQNPQIEIDKIINILSGYSNFKVCLSCKDSFIRDFEEVNGIFSILKRISKVQIRLKDFEEKEKMDLIQKYKSYYNVSMNENISKDIKNYCNNGLLFRIIFETYEGKKIKEKIIDISIMNKYIERISNNYNMNAKDVIYSLTILGEIFAKEIDKSHRLLIEEEKLYNALRMKNCNVTVDILVNINILQRYITEEIYYIDFNYKIFSYYVITILHGKLNKKNGREFINMLFELNNNRRCKEALAWYDDYLKNYQYSDVYKFKEEYGQMLMNQYKNIVNKHFYPIRDRFELNVDINEVGIAIDNGFSCIVKTYGFYKKTTNNDIVRVINFREKGELLENGIYRYSCSMCKIDIFQIIKNRLEEMIEQRCLNEDNCKYLNIEYILNSLFIYGRIFEPGYKYEMFNFIPNFNEFLPLDLIELRKKIIKFNIELLKNRGFIYEKLDDNALYQHIIAEKIEVPECNCNVERIGNVPIYSLINRIDNLINIFSLDNISAPHLIFPKNLNERNDDTWYLDIIINTFTEDELKIYLEDLISKYIDEYIRMVENNFPTIKNKFQYYNLFKEGILIELYLYKKNKPFMGSYSIRLNYCYNDIDKREVKVFLCNQRDVPKNSSKRLHGCLEGGISRLFCDDTINNSLMSYRTLSNMIYNLLNEDIQKLLDDDGQIFDEI